MSPIGYCTFPAYLWRIGREVEEKRWTTQTIYAAGDVANWTSQQEVNVREKQITVKVVTRALCFDQNTNNSVTCFRKDLLHRITCLSEESDDNYRVQIKSSG